MQSRSEEERVFRAFMLIIILFLAGASLPISHLLEVEAQPYQGGTYLFLALLIDLYHNQGSTQTVQMHPSEASSLLTYFSTPANFNESYWWLQHRPQLLELFADEGTFLLLAHNPWLFTLLHSLIDYSPLKFEKAISNRTFFNSLLQLSSEHPELRTIIGSNPILMVALIDDPNLLPRVKAILNNSQIKQILLQNPELFPYFLYNPTLELPVSAEWILILQPQNNSIITQTTSILVLGSAKYVLSQTAVYLLQNRTLVQTLSGSLRQVRSENVYLYAATLNTTNLLFGKYYLRANFTSYYGGNFTTQIIVYLTSAAPMPVINMSETQKTASSAIDLEKRS